ncbi:MAG TPA: serine/threonine-protein kinase [Kofleriaceae bacterium]
MEDERDPEPTAKDAVERAETLRGVQSRDAASGSGRDARAIGTGAPSIDLETKPMRRLRPGAPSTPEPGETTRYKLGALLGEGGMGEVVLAFDDHIGRDVAVKRIRATDPSGEELARFVREARVQGRLEHPAVVPVHDLGTDDEGRPFFVMKRLTGTTLNELLCRLRDDEEPDPAAARRRMLRAFVDVCLALEFAHQSGIIHRDVKPANVMLGDFGEVYVLDWGVARAITEADEALEHGVQPSGQHDLKLLGGDTRAGTVLGTPGYMAPEQLAGDRSGPGADIYSLGCILYEIACGEPLHPRTRGVGDGIVAIDARPSSRRAEAPPELDVICERATRVEPEERFPTARALGDAVLAFLDGDRDGAARAALARKYIGEARAALARGDGEADRRAAMQAAGRALALDPTAAEAADLVTHLVLTPPTIVPAAVETQLGAIDTQTALAQSRLAAVALLGYLGFVPLLLWTGVRDLGFVVAFAVLAIASALQVWGLGRRGRISTVGIYMNAVLNALLIGLVCRIVGPLVIAPTLVVTTLVAYAAHPQLGRAGILAGIFIAGVGVPWALELGGVLSSTYSFDHGSLVLVSPVIAYSPLPVQIAFALLLVMLPTVVALMSRVMAIRQRDATRALELQAWHLRQILPPNTQTTPTPPPPTPRPARAPRR